MNERDGARMALAAVGLLAMGSCRATPDRDSPPSPSAAAVALEAAPGDKVAQPPAPSGSRKEKEYAAPAGERLGMLPEGFGVAAGQQAPDFSVERSDGQRVSLRDLIAKGAALLVFYRGGWCPYCSFEVHELVKSFPEYRKRGVTPVAISVDRVEEAAKTSAAYEIPFPVLSDPDLAAHEAFRVLHTADDAEVEGLRGFGIDVERSSGRQHHKFAIPSLFLIDQTGRVRWAHADPDYKVRPSTSQILAAIDAAAL